MDIKLDLSKPFVETPEIKRKFEEAKNELIAVKKLERTMAMIGAFTLIPGVIGVKILNDSRVLAFSVLFYILAMIIFASKNKDQINLMKQIGKGASMSSWTDGIVEPIMKQIAPDIKTHNNPRSFPGFEECGDQGVLGRTMYNNYIMKNFNYSFEMETLYENISDNKYGFAISNATAITETESTDSKGHTTRHYTTEFKGPIIAIRLEHRFKGVVSLYSTKKGLFGTEAKDGFKKVANKIDVENEEFNKNFEVNAKEQIEAFRLLSPLVNENLLKLKAKHPSFAMMVKDDYLIVTIDSGKFILDAPKTVKEAEMYSLSDGVKEIQNTLKFIYSIKEAIDLTYLQ